MGDHKGSSTAFRVTNVSPLFTIYYPESHPHNFRNHNIEDCSCCDTNSANVGTPIQMLVVAHDHEEQNVHVLKTTMLSCPMHEIFCTCISADDSLHLFTITKAKSDWILGTSLLLFLLTMPIGSERLPLRMLLLLSEPSKYTT